MEENGEESHGMHAEDSIQEELEDKSEAEDVNGAEEEKTSGADDSLEKEDTSPLVKEKKPVGRGRGRGKKAGADGRAEGKTETKGRKRERKEPATPVIDRPARERKSIERFAASVEKEKVKEFKIEKGAGTYLKDIPNVVFKLSKRKGGDEAVQLLHKLMYGKRIKAHNAKANILQFSGFVWSTNEEKEKAKVRERLEKCVKESLLQISDILDLGVPKTSTKKEDLVVKLFEFLESPHKTTDKLLEEGGQKSKSSKRKRTPTKGAKKKASVQTPRKRQKNEGGKPSKESTSPVEEDLEEEEDEHEAEVEEESEEEMPKKKQTVKKKDDVAKKDKSPKKGRKTTKKDYEEPENVQDDEESEPEVVKSKASSRVSKKEASKASAQISSKQEKKVSSKEEKRSTSKDEKKSSSKDEKKVEEKKVPSKDETQSESGSRVFSRKKKKEDEETDTPKTEKPKKGKGSGQSNAKEESKPSLTLSDEELRAAICEILPQADFSTVTFTDVIKQLALKFGVDLTQHKDHVRGLIKEEISKIVEEDDGDEEDENDGDDGTRQDKEEPADED